MEDAMTSRTEVLWGGTCFELRDEQSCVDAPVNIVLRCAISHSLSFRISHFLSRPTQRHSSLDFVSPRSFSLAPRLSFCIALRGLAHPSLFTSTWFIQILIFPFFSPSACHIRLFVVLEQTNVWNSLQGAKLDRLSDSL